MKIIMLGAPGAGKGTQAKMIAEKYSIPHISTGDIFRANIKGGTELGMEAKKYMDQGQLVPDELTVKILLDRVAKDDCKNGYVLDGFPRTIPQAEVLDKALSELGDAVDYAIDVDVPDENIINRMGGRRACVTCGATYHMVHVPPKQEGICDKCGSELILRDELSDLVKKPLHHLRLDREDDDLCLFHDLGGRAAGDDAVLFLQGKGLCLAAVIAVKIVVPELPAVRHAGDYRPRHVAQSDKAVFHMSIPSHILFYQLNIL